MSNSKSNPSGGSVRKCGVPCSSTARATQPVLSCVLDAAQRVRRWMGFVFSVAGLVLARKACAPDSHLQVVGSCGFWVFTSKG